MGKKLYLEHEQGVWKTVLISIELTPRTNELISKAAKRSGRTKRQEAKIRLENHVEQFASVVDAKTVIGRKKEGRR